MQGEGEVTPLRRGSERGARGVQAPPSHSRCWVRRQGHGGSGRVWRLEGRGLMFGLSGGEWFRGGVSLQGGVYLLGDFGFSSSNFSHDENNAF